MFGFFNLFFNFVLSIDEKIGLIFFPFPTKIIQNHPNGKNQHHNTGNAESFKKRLTFIKLIVW
ncbi:hypothetical protein EBR03_09735 [bacterium]|nr:hypothetical protein [bacterium]